ncbi:hypothetical protein SeLEV6574_g05605 [Synchytrium endobioticum]|uniref:J domain-containing protein n=1 Tax=Synchytrium endobioticum TaxID=286115 RepID=A0A507CTM7_9FUNG|nr:hypothetical protein SeLEV6574_g05605 [Synchytrium endobioticum]
MKTDYYELLDVDIGATTDDIKKAYKKKALQLHPDKNVGREAHTTELFAQVKEAYEVLADDHERAWYDSHKDHILRGDDTYPDHDDDFVPATAGTTTEHLMKYFSNAVYNNFDPVSPNSFYTVYHELFTRLEAEEINASRSDSEARTDNSYQFNDNIDFLGSNIIAFYKKWINFSTVKSFRWKDKWRLSEAPDRRVRRAMEAENKAERDKARKEFIETVRQLAEYVRKRDPRYKSHLEACRAAQMMRDKNAAKKRLDERQERLKEAMNYEVPDWAKAEVDVELDDDGNVRVMPRRDNDDVGGQGDDDSYDENDTNGNEPLGTLKQDAIHGLDEVDFYCVACDKEFKSASQLSNHEKSKKHQKMEWVLKKQMRKEATAAGDIDDRNELSDNDDDDVFVDAPDELADNDGCDEEDDVDSTSQKSELSALKPHQQPSKSKSKKAKKRQKRRSGAEADSQVPSSDETELVNDSANPLDKSNGRNNSNKSKKRREKKKTPQGIPGEDDDDNDSTRIKARTREDVIVSDDDKDAGEIIERADGQEILGSPLPSKAFVGSNDNHHGQVSDDAQEVDDCPVTTVDDAAVSKSDDADSIPSTSTPTTKVKGVRAKRAAKAAATSTNQAVLVCGKCKTEFPTRNKLFDHIKSTGHALAPGGTGANAGGKKKGTRR